MTIKQLDSYPLPTAADIPANKIDWTISPQQAALLIHDMQEYFLNFWQADSPLIRQLIDNIVCLRQFCKKYQIPIYYSAQPHQQSDADRALLTDLWGAGITQFPQQQAIVAALTPQADDIVLEKWRYSAFFRSPLEQQLKEQGRDQLIICGVYAHIGCLTTATEAFMRDIKPFMVADALADFSREQHLQTLRHAAECCGRVLLTADVLVIPQSKQQLREQLLPLLDEHETPEDDDNLIDYGLDSVRVMQLAMRWRAFCPHIDFVALAKTPTIDHWWQLLSGAEKSC